MQKAFEGTNKMKEAIEKLSNCLEEKRFMPIECEDMIKDIIDFVNNEKYLSIIALNQELEALGWGIGVLDDNLYALTISLFGNGIRNKWLSAIRLNANNRMQVTSAFLLDKEVA